MVIDSNVNGLYSAKHHKNEILTKQLSVIRNFTVFGGEEVTVLSAAERQGDTVRAWQLGKVLALVVGSGSSRKLQVMSSTTGGDFLDKGKCLLHPHPA